MRISVIGAGYVGLVSGVCLAEVGNQVVCADRIPDRVNSILRGSSPIYEPGLDRLLRRNLDNGHLTATVDSAQAVLNSDATIIAVATPCTNGMIDLSQVKEAVRETGQALRNKPRYHVVAVKSTVVPSTTDTIVKPILEKSSGKSLGEFGLCTNPEFLREGNAVEDFLKPDRIVIGSNDEKSFRVFKRIYSAFRCPILHTNLRTAEMIKYAGNSLLAALISYSNEVASIGEAIGGIDVVDVMNGVHLDSRLTPIVNGPAKSFNRRVSPGILVYLKAGCGYGGSCLPKDVQALYAFTKKIGYEPQLLKSVIGINKHQPLRLVSRLSKEMRGLQNKKVAVWGLAFKPDTDDVRETPAKPIVDSLVRAGARVSVYDPIASENARKTLFKTCMIRYAEDKLEAARGAHALVVVTAWAQFKGVDFQKLTKLMRRNAIVVDGRRIYTRESVLRAGLRYLGVGYEELK
jgi:UDPglucose 6-dehydrogenase/GDP-mannose 6-dehydrogenase